jgi:hypothetical protein
MINADPNDRPDAAQALELWCRVRGAVAAILQTTLSP